MRSFLIIPAISVALQLNASEAGWEPCGKARFTDGLITDMIEDIDTYTFDVAVENDPSSPGRYRIADPYGMSNPYHAALGFYLPDDETAHSYIAFDVSDPENVIIEPSGIGLYVAGEEIFVESYTYLEKTGEFPSYIIDGAGLRGTFRDNAVTFTGENCFVLSYPSYYAAGKTYPTNLSRDFRIEFLPAEENGTHEISTISDSTPEYFNLQGIKITAPRTGDILIKRNDSKSSLIIIR